ncbi:unnamed protein product [Nyctereutes procyonoides]|uniref:(raccoon dog) hypothetical protein n=1 Tax=Nyctereutes procyonoides TaxID=34880 RepID=A0A811ZDQ6_NYCPR|nr:unnamed protein product [Nyctereutes procyonoides]
MRTLIAALRSPPSGVCDLHSRRVLPRPHLLPTCTRDSQPHGIRDGGQEASGEAPVVPSQLRAQGENRAAPRPRAPSCATRPKPALTSGKGAPGERFRVTGRGEAGPEEGGASVSGRSTSFRQAATLPVCPSPRRVGAGARGGVRSAGPSEPCRLPPREISVVSPEMFPSQPWKGLLSQKAFSGAPGSSGPEVFTEDTKGDIGTASGKTEGSEIEVYASQVDGMRTAMNLELHQLLSTVLKTILKDWPRTWLDGEG